MSFCSNIAMFKTRRNHTAKNSNSINCVPQIFLNECQAPARVMVLNHDKSQSEQNYKAVGKIYLWDVLQCHPLQTMELQVYASSATEKKPCWLSTWLRGM